MAPDPDPAPTVVKSTLPLKIVIPLVLGILVSLAIAVYAEDFRDGRAFVDAAAAAGKPVVLLTVGASEASARAARSHTGALVSDSAVAKHVNSIFTKLELAPADNDHRRVLAVLRFLGSG